MKILVRFLRMLMLSTALFMLWRFSTFMRKIHQQNSNLNFSSLERKSNYTCSVQGEKWIVITTIAYPTQAIVRFCSLREWNLMIVGDTKTPKNWLVNLSQDIRSKIIFLSIEDQLKLDYDIIRYIPEKSYARKNIGYLVAIKCGAKIIYESDDDNVLMESNIRVLPKQSSVNHIPWLAFHRERSPFINIYGSFGHPEIWPRGFPIDELRNVTEDGWSSLRQTQKDEHINAYIQQFLADLDPDVDAVYRLAHPMSVGHIHFDRDQQPIALEPYTFSPYNTQNTVTHYEAFWGLYLPVTTTFRVCDIWRGFWVQRLLWDIGGQLVFGTSTVRQIRNVHNYIKDMDDEQQMYHQSGKFVRFLNAWNSSLPTLSQRIKKLAIDIAQNGYWSTHEIDIMNAWLNDLSRVNYEEPNIVSSRTYNQKRKEVRTAVCVTELVECRDGGWNVTDSVVKKYFEDDVDVFVFLSSTRKNRKQIEHARRLPTAVQVFYEDRQIKYNFSLNCTPNFGLQTKFRMNSYLQQIWSLEKCYQLVHDYGQRMHIEYQLLIRARADHFFTIKNIANSSGFSPFNAKNAASAHANYYVFGDFNKRFAMLNKLDFCRIISNLHITRQEREFCFRRTPTL